MKLTALVCVGALGYMGFGLSAEHLQRIREKFSSATISHCVLARIKNLPSLTLIATPPNSRYQLLCVGCWTGHSLTGDEMATVFRASTPLSHCHVAPLEL